MLCQLPDAKHKLPLMLRSSSNIHPVLGLDTGADPFSAFTAEQQVDIGKDIACLFEKSFFPERTKTLAHSGAIITCCWHMVDDTRFLVTMRDVTEKTRSWAEKEAANAELQLLVETATAPIFQTDTEGRLVRCNPKAMSMLGYSGNEAELLGKRLAELVPAESRPAVETVLLNALDGEETESYELPLTTRSGEYVKVLLNATALRNVSKQIVGVVGIGQDVTAVQKAQAEKEDLLQCLDNSFDLVALYEVKDGISTRTWCSASHLTILGHELVACNGDQRTPTHLFPTDFLEIELPGLISAFESGEMHDGLIGEQVMLCADSQEKWFEWRMKTNPRLKNRFILISREITDRRERHRLEVCALPMTLLGKRAVLWSGAIAPLLAPSNHWLHHPLASPCYRWRMRASRCCVKRTSMSQRRGVALAPSCGSCSTRRTRPSSAWTSPAV
jgi:PAS domain S-box-containing protein